MAATSTSPGPTFDNPNGAPDTYFAYSTDCGSNWSTAENVSRNGTSSFYPDVAAGTFGVASVFWQDSAPGQLEIYFSQGTVLTITPTPLTPSSTPVLTPQIYVPMLARGWEVTPAPTRTSTHTPSPTSTPTNTPTPTPTFPPTAAFTTNAPVCDGTAVIFTNTSDMGVPPADQFLWTFGDGITTTVENPTHTHAMADSYTVTLELCNTTGCDAVTETVTVLPLPAAGFTFTTDLLTVTFTNSSSNTASYLWDFGDGITSTLEHPVHTYTTSGAYTVTLEATGACGTDETAVPVTVSAPTLTVAFPTNYPCKGAGSDQDVTITALRAGYLGGSRSITTTSGGQRNRTRGVIQNPSIPRPRLT